MNYNSIKNQEIKDQLVRQEVLINASMLISETQEKSEDLSMEILDSFYSVPDYEQAMEEHVYDLEDEEIEELEEFYAVDCIDDVDAEEFCEDQRIDAEFCEPYEFWIVSEYMGRKLEERGEIVGDFLGFTIWGRQYTGQAILLDGVISAIAEDMEILEGMKNEW